MALLRYVLFTLFTLQSIALSSLRRTAGKDKVNTGIASKLDDWNPQRDPVYDPETNLCHFESNPRCLFTPERYLFIMDAVNKFSSVSAVKNISASKEKKESFSRKARINRFSPISWDSEEEFTSPEYPAPSTQSPINPYASSHSSDSSYFASEDVLYVPEKCKDFKRKWDFIVGDPFGEECKIIGWVSRIGFADNFIREMGFPMQSAGYTLIPHRALKKAEILEILSDCDYVEIECDGEKLFDNLYAISLKVESSLIHSIIIINITYDKYGMASIKIVMKPGREHAVYRELAKVHSGVI